MNTPHEMVHNFAILMAKTDQKNSHEVMLDTFQEWDGATLPNDIEAGPMKTCFETCQKHSVWDKSYKNLSYCEGFAASEGLGIPVMHAWLIRDGKVIDPVWKAGKHEYFGIEIPHKVVLETITRTQTWTSIIESGYITDLDKMVA